MLLTWFGKNPLRKFRIIIDNPLSANWVPVDPPAFPGVPIFRIIPLKTRTLQHSPIYGWRLKLSPGAPATVIHLVFFGLHENPLPGFLVTQAVYIDSAFYVHPTILVTLSGKDLRCWELEWEGRRLDELHRGIGPAVESEIDPYREPFGMFLSLSLPPYCMYIYIFIYIHMHRHTYTYT